MRKLEDRKQTEIASSVVPANTNDGEAQEDIEDDDDPRIPEAAAGVHPQLTSDDEGLAAEDGRDVVMDEEEMANDA